MTPPRAVQEIAKHLNNRNRPSKFKPPHVQCSSQQPLCPNNPHRHLPLQVHLVQHSFLSRLAPIRKERTPANALHVLQNLCEDETCIDFILADGLGVLQAEFAVSRAIKNYVMHSAAHRAGMQIRPFLRFFHAIVGIVKMIDVAI